MALYPVLVQLAPQWGIYARKKGKEKKKNIQTSNSLIAFFPMSVHLFSQISSRRYSGVFYKGFSLVSVSVFGS